MTKLDTQLDWLIKQIKAFVLSHYSCKIGVNCKEGFIIEIEKEITPLLDNGYAAECELKRFCANAKPGDTVTFICRKDDKVGQKVKTVLRPPDV